MTSGLLNKAVEDKIKHYLATEFPNPGFELQEDTDLLNDWFVDSLGIINTLVFLESEFKVRIARGEINGENFRNVLTLSHLIRHKMKT